MRRKRGNEHISVYAVSGSHVILLGFDATEKGRKGLLGFSIHRTDHTEEEQYWLKGFKTFEETCPEPSPGQLVSSLDHPVQAFMWGDYTAKPNHKYTYRILPRYGSPEAMEDGEAVEVRISTVNEDNGFHGVFFNRGVAGSQAFSRKFGNKRPDNPQERRWLSRGLEEAMLGFIAQAKGKKYSLRACVYEFNYAPVLEAFAQADKRGADVKIVYDHRIPNKRKQALADGTAEDKDKTIGEHSDDAIAKAGIRHLMIPREKSPNDISHNKFIILLKDGEPNQVWTGSTNFTSGGIFGQSNVGHIIRDKELAAKYYQYWQKISQDPEKNEIRNFNSENTRALMEPPPENSLFPLFSPRPTKEDPYLIDWYGERIKEASDSIKFTAAFGVNKEFVDIFMEPSERQRYIILDNAGSRKSSRQVTQDIMEVDGNRVAIGDVYKNGKSKSKSPAKFHNDGRHLDRWLDEKLTGMNSHVRYVHTKYLIVDALTNDPILISGSANFSKNSTVNNDENMVISRGNLRLTDMFLGEFMRLWSHFYARNVAYRQAAGRKTKHHSFCYLESDDSWTQRYYEEGTPQYRERELFSGMHVGGHSITFFDIDETIFHTHAKVYVKKGNKIVKKLNNQEFNTYQLQPGEQFDFKEFRDADLFAETSTIITPTLAKIKAQAKNAFKKGSTMALLTARSRFKDMATFKEKFERYGIPVVQMDINFAGDISQQAGSVAEAKKQIVEEYLSHGEYDTARLVDDNMENLRAFLSIAKDMDHVKFEAIHIDENGKTKTVK